jgi:hypothetical protein
MCVENEVKEENVSLNKVALSHIRSEGTVTYRDRILVQEDRTKDTLYYGNF